MAEPGSPDEALEAARALFEDALAANEHRAAVLAYDLHAIRNGWDTIGTYDMLTWMQARSLLEGMTSAELEALIGPPVRP